MTKNTAQARSESSESASWERLSGYAAIFLLLYCLVTIVQVLVLGGPPDTASNAFDLLQQSRIRGLLRLDLVTMLAMPVYYLLLLGLFGVLRRTSLVSATVGTAFGFVGVTLLLATPTAISMLSLSEKYAAAQTNEMRLQFLAAGEAILASDIWHGTGARIGGVLLQVGIMVLCFVMLRSGVFGKTVAWLGIFTFGLDLAHILAGVFSQKAGVILMAASGPFYPVWFFLIGRKLLKAKPRTGRTSESDTVQVAGGSC